jgi:hypothetical protein
VSISNLQVTAIFKSLGFNEFTTQVEKQDFQDHMSKLGVNYETLSKGSSGHLDGKFVIPDSLTNVKFV